MAYLRRRMCRICRIRRMCRGGRATLGRLWTGRRNGGWGSGKVAVSGRVDLVSAAGFVTAKASRHVDLHKEVARGGGQVTSRKIVPGSVSARSARWLRVGRGERI